MRLCAHLLCAVVLAAACSSGGTVPTDSGDPSLSGERVAIAVGETATLPGTDVTLAFLAVAGDSRCPRDVECVWAGNGRVDVGLAGAGEFREASLNTTVAPRAIEFEGLRVTLVDLDPDPLSSTPIDPDAYVATFAVDGDRPRERP